MADERLRRLERAALTGDSRAAKALEEARARAEGYELAPIVLCPPGWLATDAGVAQVLNGHPQFLTAGLVALTEKKRPGVFCYRQAPQPHPYGMKEPWSDVVTLVLPTDRIAWA